MEELIPVQDLFDAFLSTLESDEWEVWDEGSIHADMTQLMKAAIPWFKFPRCSFKTIEEGEYFEDPKVSNTELQILALFMKTLWYGRVIDSWENLRPLYTERDFSPALQLKQFTERQKQLKSQAEKLESIYYRSRDGKPFDYRKLSGGR